MANQAEAPARMVDRQRAKRGELVREEVIDAALAEFAERGYHQTSISHIAKRLGAGHSMFYRYFENKRDILDHVVRHANGRFVAAIAQTMPGRLGSLEDFRDGATRLGMACIDVLSEDPRLSRLLAVQSVGVDRDMTEGFHRVFDGGTAALEAMLHTGIQAGYIRSDIDVTGTAESIVAIPFGLLLRHAHQPDREALGARVRSTVDLVCAGIGSPVDPNASVR